MTSRIIKRPPKPPETPREPTAFTDLEITLVVRPSDPLAREIYDAWNANDPIEVFIGRGFVRCEIARFVCGYDCDNDPAVQAFLCLDREVIAEKVCIE